MSATNIFLAMVMAAMLCAACLLDGPDDITTQQLVADDLAAVKTAQTATVEQP